MDPGPSGKRPLKRMCTEKAREMLEMDTDFHSILSDDSSDGSSSASEYDFDSDLDGEHDDLTRSRSSLVNTTNSRGEGSSDQAQESVDGQGDAPLVASTSRAGIKNPTTGPRPKKKAKSRSTKNKETLKWKEVVAGTTSVNFRFTRSQSHGVNNELCNEGSSELDCLFSLLTLELLDNPLININAYGEKRKMMNTPLRKHSAFHRMEPVTRPDLFNFCAILIAMGLDQRESIKSYWSAKKAHKYTPWYGETMTRPRFEMIYHTMLHASGEDTMEQEKVEPFLKALVSNFQTAFYPNRELSIDEMVIGYKGRWRHKQFNASNPSKYHIKIFGLCNSATGYVYNVFTYYGNATSYHPDLNPNCAQAVKVFEKLMSTLDKGHHVFGDRFYTSVPLLDFLFQRNHHYTGTIDVRRKYLPPQLKTLQLNQHEMKWFMEEEEKYLVVSYRDKKAKKNCSVVTSNGDVATTTIQRRAVNIEKPTPIHHYNHFMNGCDRADQQVTYYGAHKRKSHKWWKKIFFWLLELSHINASILFDLTRPRHEKYRRLSLAEFKDNLILQLTHTGGTAPLLPRRPPPDNSVERIAPTTHFMESSDKDRNCRVCNKPDKRKNYKCVFSLLGQTPSVQKGLSSCGTQN